MKATIFTALALLLAAPMAFPQEEGKPGIEIDWDGILKRASLSGSGEGTWRFRRPVSIRNPGGESGKDIQVKVTLDLRHGSVFRSSKKDGSDLRFCLGHSLEEIPHFTEFYDSDSCTASLWIPLAVLPPGGTTVHLYYGNPRAVAEGARRIFPYFEPWTVDHTKDWLLKAPATNYQHYWETKKTFTSSRELRKKSMLKEWHPGPWDHTELGWTRDRASFYNKVDHVLIQWHQNAKEGATKAIVPVRLSLRRGDTTAYSEFKMVRLPDPKHELYLTLTYTPKKVSYVWKNLETGVVLAQDAIEDPEKIPPPETTGVLVNGSLSCGGTTGSYFSPCRGGYLKWGNKPGNGGMVWITDYWFVRKRMELESRVKVGAEKANSLGESVASKDFIARVEEAKGSERELVSVLNGVLDESDDGDLRWLACKVLGVVKPAGTVPVLKRTFETDSSFEVVWAAASALVAVDPAKAKEYFIGALAGLKDPERLCPAIRMLGRMKAARAVKVLEKEVVRVDGGFEVRREAVGALGEIGDRNATDALVACLETVEQRDVLFIVLVTLGGIPSSKMVEKTVSLIEREDDRVLADAAWKTYLKVLGRFDLPGFPLERTRARLFWKTVKEYTLWGEIRVTPELKRTMEELIVDLDDEDYKVREKAHKKLKSMAALAASLLKKALSTKSLEVRFRARQILDSITPDDLEVLDSAEHAAARLKTSADFLRIFLDSPDKETASRAKELLGELDRAGSDGK